MGAWESAEIAMEKPARALEQLKKAAVLKNFCVQISVKQLELKKTNFCTN